MLFPDFHPLGFMLGHGVNVRFNQLVQVNMHNLHSLLLRSIVQMAKPVHFEFIKF